MSIQVLNLVWAVRGLDATAKLVLLRLADFSDDTGGQIFPSVGRVADDTGLSERAVRQALRRLEDTGALRLVAKEDSGRHRAREYRIELSFFAGGSTCRPEAGAGRNEVPGGTSFRVGGHDVPPRGAPDAPRSVIEPLENRQGVRPYAFEGKVVRLNYSDFDNWTATYHAIPDMKAELAAIDAWLVGQPETKRKGWFHSVPGMLSRKHQERLAAAPPTPKRRPQITDLPEFAPR
ncbi:helix-turn-helix protein [Nitrospirillum amazonense]|uniref:Helix-turn-helix protein n=1 Tax=Nitrospirillum amazonense TaxID=28077 RepID=A0A560FKM4_9PROT|nr:helix-turn-helix domain-containing protein [Nitrospirillum amazonense]TWB22149.1 helix-turn-helix protein [Nitrospirillum amazonense]